MLTGAPQQDPDRLSLGHPRVRPSKAPIASARSRRPQSEPTAR